MFKVCTKKMNPTNLAYLEKKKIYALQIQREQKNI